MNIYRLSSWTHREPKVSVGFKAPTGEHVVMVAIGNIASGEALTEARLLAMLEASGLELSDDAAVTRDDGDDNDGR